MIPAPAISYEGDVTRLDHPNFVLHLPFRWSQHANNGEQIEYRNQTLPDQLFIRLQATARTMRDEELATTRQQVVDAMKRAAIANGSSQLRLSDPVTQEAPGDVEARLFGVDPSKEVAFAMLLRLTPKCMLQISLYRYTLANFGVPFEADAGAIFDFVVVRDS